MTQSEIKPDAELDEPLRFERLLAEISPFFINLPADRIDSEIEAAQRRVCELLDLDRSSLFQASERDPETLMLTHFYQPPGSRIPPERMSLKEFFPWALQKVLGGETVTISKMTDLPAEAGQDRETFGLYGTRSVVVVPLSIGGGPPFGVLTFAVIREERGWPETVVKSFQLIAQVFPNALARKRADEALRDSEERMSLAVDSADVGLWVLDYRTSVFWASEKARVIFGYSADQVIGMEHLEALVHPDDWQLVQGSLERAQRAGEPVNVEYRIRPGDSQTRWIASRGRPYSTPTGQPDCLMGASIDITERKQAEQLLEDWRQIEFEPPALSGGRAPHWRAGLECHAGRTRLAGCAGEAAATDCANFCQRACP